MTGFRGVVPSVRMVSDCRAGDVRPNASDDGGLRLSDPYSVPIASLERASRHVGVSHVRPE